MVINLDEMPIYRLYFKDKDVVIGKKKDYKPLRLSTERLLDLMEHFWVLGYKIADLAIDDASVWHALQDYKKDPSELNFYFIFRLIDFKRARDVADLQSVALKNSENKLILINRLGAVETNDIDTLHKCVKYLKTMLLVEKQNIERLRKEAES